MVREQIHKDVRVLVDQAHALSIRSNELALVSRLPPEILSKIFIDLRVAVINHNHVDLTWIYVSQVCSHWRAVALNCPRLWNRIVFSRPRWVSQMLSRSSMVPLIILATTDINWNNRDTVSLALDDFSKVLQLHLTAETQTLRHILAQLHGPPSLLESLQLKNVATFDDAHPLTFKSIVMPRLRRIKLVSCGFDWDTLNVSCLTHLELGGLGSTIRPTMSQLLAVLRQSPCLQRLVLSRAIPPVQGTVDVKHPVSLPDLSHLSLSDRYEECTALLGHLFIPTSATVDVEPDLYHCSNLNDDIVELLHALERPPYDSLELSELSFWDTYVRITAWHPSVTEPRSDTFTFIVEDPAAVWDPIPLSTAINAACRTLPLKGLRKLRVQDMQSVTKAEWIGLANQLHGTQILSCWGKPPYELFSALLEGNQVEEGTVKADIFLPDLKTVKLKGTDFSHHDVGHTLMGWLLERQKKSAAIDIFVIEECRNIPAGLIAWMQDNVPQVRWDGTGESKEMSLSWSTLRSD
jgi:hypothetical protein